MTRLTNDERQRMSFADVRWFLNKDKQIYGSMITETIGELTIANPSEKVTYHDIYLEANLEFMKWRQHV